MWNARFRFRYGDVEVFFGPYVLRENLINTIRGLRRVLIVSSKNAARVSGALRDVVRVLEDNSVEYTIYDRVSPNPYASTADDVAESAKKNNAEALIAIGGGSVIDVSKTASLLTDDRTRARDVVLGKSPSGRRLRLIVVNLTHGTGSEINRFAVLTLDGTIEKRGFLARYPDASFDDSIYTLTLSREQSLYTSIDTFYHAYESATARRTNLLVATLAEETIDVVKRYLGRVLENPQDLEARTMLLYASMLGGLSDDLTGGSHVIHAVEHGLSGLRPEMPHGAGLAIVGPSLVYYIHRAVPEISARLLRPLDPSIKPLSEDAEKAVKTVEKFQREHGFDKSLRDYDIEESDLRLVLDFVDRMIFERYGSNTPFAVSRSLLEEVLRKLL